MAELTRAEMEDILFLHEKAELELDIEATLATLVPDPHFEVGFMGLRVDGMDAVRRLYNRMLIPGAGERNIQAIARVVAADKNAIIREAHASFDRENGERVTGVYIVTVEFDPELKKIKAERMYGDPTYGEMMTKLIGEDFINEPGVSRTSDHAPIITRHDAYDHAAARGATITRPEKF